MTSPCFMDTGRALTDLGQTPESERTMRRTLVRARRNRCGDQIAGACLGHATPRGDLPLCWPN